MKQKSLLFFALSLLLLASAVTAARHSVILRSGIAARQSNVCAGHTVGEFVKNPENCNLFYLCMEREEAVMAACPPAMLFNDATHLCDAAENVKCEIETPNGGNGTSNGNGSSNANNTNNNNNSNNGTNNNNNGNNGNNNTASNGNNNSPNNGNSNSNNNTPNNGNNNNNTPNNGNNNNNTPNNGNNNNNNQNTHNELQQANRYCASLPSNFTDVNFIGSDQSCSRYYICYHGQAMPQQCSDSLHWNANTAKCDKPEQAGCLIGGQFNTNNGNANGNGVIGSIDGSINTGGNSSGNTGRPDNNNNENNGDLINCPPYGQHIFPHMERCDYYIYCVKGQAILQQCPFYYHFDIVTKNCQWRTEAVCIHDLNINFRKLINL